MVVFLGSSNSTPVMAEEEEDDEILNLRNAKKKKKINAVDWWEENGWDWNQWTEN